MPKNPAPPQLQPKPQLHAGKKRSATPEADWSALAGDGLTDHRADALGGPFVKKQASLAANRMAAPTLYICSVAFGTESYAWSMAE